MSVGRLSAIPEGTRYYDENDGGGKSEGKAGDKDVDYWKAEAKKAFTDRDSIKEKLRALEGKSLSDEDRDLFDKLKAEQADAEEKRKRRAGEFDALKQQLTEQHTKAVKERDEKITALSSRFKNTVIRAEFGAASDYFSGAESSKTILDVELGIAALGKYVAVEELDDDPEGYRVIVKNPKGQTIMGSDGNPAPFAEAIGELIGALPNKDRILRGGGKTGSGSSGGTSRSAIPDLVELTQLASKGDKKALEALRARRAANGGMVMGEAFTR
jgi:hypothetical protein